MNALDPFYRAAKRHPQALALVQGRGAQRMAISFGALAHRIPRLAAGLAAHGLKQGDRAVLMVPMSIELYELLLACFHLGVSAVFLDAWSGLGRLKAAAELAAPQAYLASPMGRLLGLAVPAIRKAGFRASIHARFAPLHRLYANSPSSLFQARSNSEALVTFTTGSTGAPKGAPRSHAFLLAQQAALRPTLGKRPPGPDYPVLPVFVLFNLAEGIPTVLPDLDPAKPTGVDPASVFAHWKKEGVVTSSGSPLFFERLAKVGRLPLKKLFVGGAAVMPALAKKLADQTDGDVVVVYGSTEAEPISDVSVEKFIQSSKTKRLGLLAGKPGSVQIKILKPFDGPIQLGRLGWKDWELKKGGIGEILIQGDHVQTTYINDPEAWAKNKVQDGAMTWHRTGDAGYLDAKGNLHLMGRLAQRVLRQGKTWWGLEAEKRALEMPGVRFAVYFGRPHARLGQEAVLCLETTRGQDLESAKKALAPWPVDRLYLLKNVPRDPRHNSKPDWERLRLQLG